MELEPRHDFRVLDLFAGAGGLSAGLRRASRRFHTVAAVELDKDAAATFSANFREATVYCGRLEEWLDLAEVPDVDVVIGGPPCQGFSALGSRDEQDERSGLWAQYVEVVARARPYYFVLENVPQFLTSPQYAEFVESFQPRGPLAGYRLQARVLNSHDYGSAQVRKRVLVLGMRQDAVELEFPAITTARPRTVRDAFASVPSGVSADALPSRLTQRGQPSRGPYLTTELHLGRAYTQLSRDRFAAIPAGGNRFDLPEHLKAPCWRQHTTGSGDVMGRLRWDRPSVTIRTEFFKPEKGRYLHPSEDRAITHLEAALLQGFSPKYRWYGSKTSIARQIGNAVPIELGAAIGRKLIDALDRTRSSAVLPSDQPSSRTQRN